MVPFPEFPCSWIVESLPKTYPNGVRALTGVSLTIDTGMFGLLGPNGGGKSTLIVETEPKKAGTDPYNKPIDRNPKDTRPHSRVPSTECRAPSY